MILQIGYVRPTKRDTARKQIAALTEHGVDEARIYVEGRDGESLEAATKALRRGGKLCVLHLGMLAPPRRTTRDSPRRAMVAHLRAIEAKGASVVEASTGRDTATDERDVMLLDAVDWLAGRARGHGRGRRGRPSKEFTPEQVDAARRAWFDLRHATWAEAARHLPKGFSVDRAYKLFGPREGGQT